MNSFNNDLYTAFWMIAMAFLAWLVCLRSDARQRQMFAENRYLLKMPSDSPARKIHRRAYHTWYISRSIGFMLALFGFGLVMIHFI